MKKLFKNFLMLTAVGAIAFLYSCSEEDEPTAAAPSISVSAALADGTALADGGNVITGNTITVTVNATTPGGFNVVRATSGGSTQEFTRTTLQLDAGATSASFNITDIATPDEAVGTTIDWTFTVVDDLNQTGETTLSYTVDAVPSPPATVLTARMLAAPTGDNTSMTFYSIRLNQLYSQADVIGTADPVSENIDLGYYYGGTNNATLVSPDEYPTNIVDITSWGTRHTTNLVLTTISSETYMGITSVADVTGAVADVTFGDSNEVTNLAVGDILAFETTDETAVSGLIMVQEVNGTDGSDGNIVIELITSQEGQ